MRFRESRRTPTSHFWECGLHPHTWPKVGLRHKVKIGDGAPLQFDSISELDVVGEFIKEKILQVKVNVHQQLLFKLQMNQKF